MEETPQIKPMESVKLSKMSKGYNWEIRLLDAEDITNQIKRLELIDAKLRNTYGDKNIEPKI